MYGSVLYTYLFIVCFKPVSEVSRSMQHVSKQRPQGISDSLFRL